MKDYDAYLFDWDGTLADSHPMWLGIIRRQLEEHGKYLSDREIVAKIFGRYLTGMRELGFSEQELEKLDRQSLDAATKGITSLPLFPQARDILERLAQMGKNIGLITASYRNVVETPLQNHKIIDLFDVIVTGDKVRAQKPDPEMVLNALSAIGVEPGRAIVVGDSPKDLLAARNAGTDSLLFYPPEHELEHSREELEACGPTYTIRSWQELLDQLQ